MFDRSNVFVRLADVNDKARTNVNVYSYLCGWGGLDACDRQAEFGSVEAGRRTIAIDQFAEARRGSQLANCHVFARGAFDKHPYFGFLQSLAQIGFAHSE